MNRRRTITFEGGNQTADSTQLAAQQNTSNRLSLESSTAHTSSNNPLQQDLHKVRPEPTYHPGQDLSDGRRKQNQVGTLRHGYERLGQMYSLGIPLKFEELQGRHPFDFVEETKEHYKLHPDPVKKPAEPEDTTLFDVREWLEPLIRKGQLYWDYCRDKWLEKESKLGAACAPISCMYSLWSVTESCVQYGGLVFMAAYLILTVVFIIPFIYMELTIGQFHRQGLVKAVKQTCPLFQGLAYLMLLSSLFDYLLSMTRMSWLSYYLQSGVNRNLPWQFCGPWSSNNCKETMHHDQLNVSYSAGEVTPAVEWYKVHVSRPWNHWEIGNGKPTIGQTIAGILPNPRIIFSFLLLLFIFRLLMKLWCRPLGTLMFGTFFVAFVHCTFSLAAVHHIFPPERQRPIVDWFLKSDHLKHFYSKNAWTSVIRHAVIGSGIGTGIYITFGSHNTFPHDEIKRMSVLSGLASFTVHFFVATFFIICNFTIRSTVSFEKAKVENYGSDIMFEQFPQMAAQHHQLGFARIIFFVVINGILLLASLRVLCSLHTIRQHFFDGYKEYYEPCRVNYNYWEHDKNNRQQRYIFLHVSPKRKGELITKIMFYTGIFHVLSFFAGGSDILFFVESFWYNYVPVFIVIMECIAVFFLAGVRTLNEYVRKMTTRQVTLWYRFVWKTIIPFFPVLYVCTPPRVIGEVGGVLPKWANFIGYVTAGLPLFFMYMSVLHTWRKSRAKTCCNKFLLEVTPQHEHAGMITGRKPSTRLHWMHHLHVPAGISRGQYLPSYEGPPRKPSPNRFMFDNRVMNFLWYTLRLRWFNVLRNDCVNHPDEDNNPTTDFHMFPRIPFPMKPPKKEVPFPEYIPNQAVKRVHKLKKYKDFQKQRKYWLSEKVDLEQERMAAEHDERDIETGIIAVSKAAAQAHSEDEEKEFFDLFDSSEGEGWESSSTESSDESFDPSSDNGRGKVSSASVSTSDSFDSQNSLFRVSTEEDIVSSKSKTQIGKDSDSSSEEDEDPEECIEEIQVENEDEVMAPAMDYEENEGIPFDDDTDSWELEALEDLEDDSGQDNEIDDTSDVETDTDELINGLGESPQESESTDEDDSDDEDGVDEDEEAMEEVGGAYSEKRTSENKSEGNNESEESNSWSISCGSESSCSSLYSDSSSDSDEESDEDDEDSDGSDDSAPNKANHKVSFVSKVSQDDSIYIGKRKTNKLKVFRKMAESLDTFLHISKKKEKEKMGIVQEKMEKARKDQEVEKKGRQEHK